MGFIPSLVDLAMQKLHLLLLLLNLIKSTVLHFVNNNTVYLDKSHHFLSRVEWIKRLLLIQWIWVRLPIWSNQNLKTVCIHIQLPG